MAIKLNIGDTEFLREEQQAVFELKLIHDSKDGCKASFNIDGNAFIIHSMLEALLKAKPEIREIFQDVIEELDK